MLFILHIFVMQGSAVKHNFIYLFGFIIILAQFRPKCTQFDCRYKYWFGPQNHAFPSITDIPLVLTHCPITHFKPEVCEITEARCSLMLHHCNFKLTFPVMAMQPSWSMISTSSCEGGWQNFCWRICRMCSMTLGVSLRATAMWPRARMVWSGIRWASLTEKQGVLEQLLTSVKGLKIRFTTTCCSLFALLWNVQTVGQAGQKGLHYHRLHCQTSF